MARQRKGYVEEHNGRYYVRLTVTLDNGKSTRRRVPKGGFATRAEAERRRDALAAKAAKRTFATNTSPDILFREYLPMWLSAREKRGLRTVRKDRERLNMYVVPLLGDLPMQEITADHLRELVELLDARMHDPGAKFGWKTARHVWMTTRKLFKDACRSKQAALRVLNANPAEAVEGPDRGADKAKQWLYPIEFSQLMECRDVPLRWRRIYAVATLLFLRLGEVRALAWRDIDLVAGTAYIHEQVNDETGLITPTKESDVRHVRIEATLLPLLEALRAESPEADRLFSSIEHPAKTLREHLLRASVTRSALHRETSTSLAMRFHDLRATGITWMALRGDPIGVIRERAGHSDLESTQEYLRRAELVGLGIGGPFPELPVAISAPTIGPATRKRRVLPKETLCEGGDLKPHRGRQVAPEQQKTPGNPGAPSDRGAPERTPGPLPGPIDEESDFLAALVEHQARAEAYQALSRPAKRRVKVAEIRRRRKGAANG